MSVSLLVRLIASPAREPIAWLAAVAVALGLLWLIIRHARKAFAEWANLVNDFRRRNWLGMDRRKWAEPVEPERRLQHRPTVLV